MSVSISAVLPFGCVTSAVPFRSAYELIFASDRATTWKYCGYRFASWQTLVTFFGYGGRPSMPSTVVLELARPICALPSSTPRMLAMPAPGCWVICRPGTAFSHMPLRAPPSGIQEPPCGPVMNVTCCAAAGAAASASAAPITIVFRFIPSSSKKTILDHAGQHRLAGEVPAQILDLQIAHRLARLHGGAGDVREKHRVLEREERRRHARLVGEDIEAGAGDLFLLQITQQHRLVHHGAARDVHEITLGSERVQHGGVDEVVRRRSAGCDDHQDVRILRQRHWIRVVGIGHVFLVAVVVADFHAAGERTLRDHLADASEPEDAEHLAAERGREGIGAARGPVTGAQI